MTEPGPSIRQDERLASDLLDVVLPLGAALSAEKDFDRLLERILLEARNLCHADGGTLYLRQGDALAFAMLHTQSLGLALGGTTGVAIPFASLPIHDESGEGNYANVATSAALSGKSINISDVYGSLEYDFSGTKRFDQANNYQTVSSLTVPLKNYDDEVVGVLQLINAIDPQSGEVIPFDGYLQQVVESLASLAAVALNNQMLLQSEKELAKIQHDMTIATQLQEDFLPSELPSIKRWQIVPYFQAARGVAGDFYDVFRLPSGHICIVLADVCDKGVGAALFMVLIRSLIRAFAAEMHLTGVTDNLTGTGKRVNVTQTQFSSVMATLAALNTVVRTNDYVYFNHMKANMFATMFFGVLDSDTGLMKYVNGGHNPPVLIRADNSQELLHPSGPAVGMFPGTNFKVREAQFQPGDALFIYTDGVTEARAADGEFFTEKRLFSCVFSATAEDLMAHVKSRLFAHIGDAEQYDDITMMAVARLAGDDEGAD